MECSDGELKIQFMWSFSAILAALPTDSIFYASALAGSPLEATKSETSRLTAEAGTS